MLQSYVLMPQDLNGGILVASPAHDVLPFTTDAFGTATIENIKQLGADISVYHAGCHRGPIGSRRARASPTRSRCAFCRGTTRPCATRASSLIQSVNGGPSELYDLALDPLETINLLAAGPVNGELEDARVRLLAALDEL